MKRQANFSQYTTNYNTYVKDVLKLMCPQSKMDCLFPRITQISDYTLLVRKEMQCSLQEPNCERYVGKFIVLDGNKFQTSPMVNPNLCDVFKDKSTSPFVNSADDIAFYPITLACPPHFSKQEYDKCQFNMFHAIRLVHFIVPILNYETHDVIKSVKTKKKIVLIPPPDSVNLFYSETTMPEFMLCDSTEHKGSMEDDYYDGQRRFEIMKDYFESHRSTYNQYLRLECQYHFALKNGMLDETIEKDYYFTGVDVSGLSTIEIMNKYAMMLLGSRLESLWPNHLEFKQNPTVVINKMFY